MTARHEGATATRIAVLGAETPVGRWIRRALERAEIADASVDLFGRTAGQAILSEYRGEARLIQEPDSESLSTHGVVFVCEPGTAANDLIAAESPDRLVIDVGGIAAARGVGQLAHVGIVPRDVVPQSGIVTAPHPLSIAVMPVLQPIAVGPGIESVTVVALRPAGDFGEAGIEELRGQAVGLLNFSSIPTEVFGRQLAFNCIPQSLVRDDVPDLDRLVASQIATLLDLDAAASSFRSVVAAVFYGHGFLLRVETRDPVEPGDLSRQLASAAGVEVVADGTAATPVEVDGHDSARVTGLDSDGPRRFWMWLAVDRAGEVAGRHAVAIARRAGRL